jgi:tryptophan synthase alpha subunit
VPVIMMGYLNPLLAYGVEKLAVDSGKAGVDGFIVVDMPGEQAKSMIAAFTANGLSFIPLITPTTTDDRIAKVVKLGSGFVYCVSVNGTTGARGQVAGDIAICTQLWLEPPPCIRLAS